MAPTPVYLPQARWASGLTPVPLAAGAAEDDAHPRLLASSKMGKWADPCPPRPSGAAEDGAHPRLLAWSKMGKWADPRPPPLQGRIFLGMWGLPLHPVIALSTPESSS